MPRGGMESFVWIQAMTPGIDSAAALGTPMFSFRSLVLCSGHVAHFGWLALVVVVLAALIVIARHTRYPDRRRHGTAFFGVAHVCLLLFLNNVGVCGLMASLSYECVPFSLPAAQLLVSLAIGLGIVGIASVTVAAVLRQLPAPSWWDCLGMGAIVTSFCVLFGVLFAVMLELERCGQ